MRSGSPCSSRSTSRSPRFAKRLVPSSFDTSSILCLDGPLEISDRQLHLLLDNGTLFKSILFGRDGFQCNTGNLLNYKLTRNEIINLIMVLEYKSFPSIWHQEDIDCVAQVSEILGGFDTVRTMYKNYLEHQVNIRGPSEPRDDPKQNYDWLFFQTSTIEQYETGDGSVQHFHNSQREGFVVTKLVKQGMHMCRPKVSEALALER